jgi:hypothetical protein
MTGNLPAQVREIIQTAIGKHEKEFGNWPPSEEDRERLEKLSAGIRIN